MTHGGLVYPLKQKNKENLSLKRTLNVLDYERRLKMRELESKRKQFLHEHRRSSSIRSDSFHEANARDNDQEKIDKRKEKEKQSSQDLNNRSTDFIQELRVKPLSTLIKMERKPSPVESESSQMQPDETPKLSLNSKVIALYQKGFADVLRPNREKRVSPFMKSVNAILDQLKATDEGGGNTKDAMGGLTRKIFSKYAGLDTRAAGTISEDNENKSENVSPVSAPPHNGETIENTKKNMQDGSELKTEKDADEYLKSEKHSSKGLRLWARVKREQNSVKLLNKRGRVNTTSSSLGPYQTEGEITTCETGQALVGSSKSRASPKHHNASPNRPNLPGSANSEEEIFVRSNRRKSNGSLSPGMKSGISDSTRSNTSPNRKSISISKSAKHGGTRSASKRHNESGTKRGNFPTCPIVSVEDYTKEVSPKTVIIVHDDNSEDDVNLKPLQWDQSHRYSLSDIDVSGMITPNSNSPENDSTSTDDCRHDLASEEETPEQLNINSNYENSQTLKIESNATPESFMERDELQPSALSMYSGSEPTTSGTRSQSRAGRKKSRRLSVQTSGALRVLTSVLNEEMKQAEKRETDTSYRDMVDALAGVATGVEEQARRLDNVRRAGPGITGRDKLSSSGDRRQVRRNSVTSPERKNPTFVTNEVYKFLERRTSSKTMTRRPTLSKLELRLLSQAPGEDMVGRRGSLSNMTDSHRSSLDVVSNASSARGSISGSMADIPTNFLEAERQRSSRRHSTSAVPEGLSPTPRSASRLSNISENGSLASMGGGKTGRSYSWAPDVSETTDWHILAMELLAKNRGGMSRFRTVNHMLKWLGEEYRRQTASMMYEELRYCTYLRLAPYQVPNALKDSNVSGIFHSDD